jgi:hypothetical protein
MTVGPPEAEKIPLVRSVLACVSPNSKDRFLYLRVYVSIVNLIVKY